MIFFHFEQLLRREGTAVKSYSEATFLKEIFIIKIESPDCIFLYAWISFCLELAIVGFCCLNREFPDFHQQKDVLP